MSNRLRNAFGRLEISKKNQDYLIPATLGFLLDGNETVEVPTRNGYVYVRVRGNLNEVAQAFNDKVSPVYDLPVLLIRDPNNPTRYKIEGRDIGRYEDWGTSSAFLPRHGGQHSFNPQVNVGSDPVWVFSQQVMPWLVSPSGTFGSGNVVISGYPTLKNNAWVYLGNTGTASLLTYVPSGSFSRMVLVYLDGNGNPALSAGSTFAISTTGTSLLLGQVPNIPNSSSLPLAAIYLPSGTSRIEWGNIYDLRPFFVGGGGGGSTSGDLSLIRLWDYSASAFQTFAATTAGLTSAVAASGAGDIIYLPPVSFTGVELTISANIIIIGASYIRGSPIGTRLSNTTGNPVLNINSANVQIENLYISTTNTSGNCVAIEAGYNSLVLINVDVFAFSLGGTIARAIQTGYDTYCLGCVFASNIDGTYSHFPFDVAPNGIYDVSDPGYDSPNTFVTTRNLRVGDNETSYLDVGTTGTLSFAGGGGIRIPCVTGSFSIPPTASQITGRFGSPAFAGSGFLSMINVSGTNDYLIASNGYDWFHTLMTKAA
jgi:hypothetical protein